MEVACTLLSTDVQEQVHSLSKEKGAGTETLLQHLFTPVAKYFSYCQWEFIRVHLMPLHL